MLILTKPFCQTKSLNILYFIKRTRFLSYIPTMMTIVTRGRKRLHHRSNSSFVRSKPSLFPEHLSYVKLRRDDNPARPMISVQRDVSPSPRPCHLAFPLATRGFSSSSTKLTSLFVVTRQFRLHLPFSLTR